MQLFVSNKRTLSKAFSLTNSYTENNPWIWSESVLGFLLYKIMYCFVWFHTKLYSHISRSIIQPARCVFSPVFVCSYMLLAPCFGYLGDRYNRKWIMCVGISFWSVVTLASSYTPENVSQTVVFFALKTEAFRCRSLF